MSQSIFVHRVCGFCGRKIEDVELLFVAPIGGDPPCICDLCVEERAGAVKLFRDDPDQALAIIEEARAKLHRKWLDDHPMNAMQPL